jgi:hypothetical protein
MQAAEALELVAGGVAVFRRVAAIHFNDEFTRVVRVETRGLPFPGTQCEEPCLAAFGESPNGPT